MTNFTIIICSTKNLKQIWGYQIKGTMLQIGGRLGVMLHLGAYHSNNHQIILIELFAYDIFYNYYL